MAPWDGVDIRVHHGGYRTVAFALICPTHSIRPTPMWERKEWIGVLVNAAENEALDALERFQSAIDA